MFCTLRRLGLTDNKGFEFEPKFRFKKRALIKVWLFNIVLFTFHFTLSKLNFVILKHLPFTGRQCDLIFLICYKRMTDLERKKEGSRNVLTWPATGGWDRWAGGTGACRPAQHTTRAISPFLHPAPILQQLLWLLWMHNMGTGRQALEPVGAINMYNCKQFSVMY